jgi:hypothetical protein
MSWKYESWQPARANASEVAAISDYVASRGFTLVRTTSMGNHWFYWLRGIWLSNISSMYLVVATAPDKNQYSFHAVFDPMAKSKGMQVFLEKRAP